MDRHNDRVRSVIDSGLCGFRAETTIEGMPASVTVTGQLRPESVATGYKLRLRATHAKKLIQRELLYGADDEWVMRRDIFDIVTANKGAAIYQRLSYELGRLKKEAERSPRIMPLAEGGAAGTGAP